MVLSKKPQKWQGLQVKELLKVSYRVVEPVVCAALFEIFEGRRAEVTTEAVKQEGRWAIAFYSHATILARLTASDFHTVNQVAQIAQAWFNAEISKCALTVNSFMNHEGTNPAEVHCSLCIGPISDGCE